MKKANAKITRYQQGKFYIDIVDNGKGFEAWITGKKYGVSDLMFGMPKKQATEDITEEHFLELVEASFSEYAAGYIEEYGL